MGNIPLPALAVNPPQTQDLVGGLSKIMGLQNMRAQLQGSQLENQQRAQSLKDSQAMTQSMLNWDPSTGYDALAHSVLQNGGSAQAATGIAAHGIEIRQKALDLAKTDEENQSAHLANLGKRNDLLLGHLSTVVDGPDEGIGQRLTMATQQAVQDRLIDQPHAQQILQFAQLPPAQLRPALSIFEKSLQGESVQFQRAMDERKQNSAEWKEGGPGTIINTRTGETRQGTLPVDQQSFNNYMQTVKGATPAGYPAWKADQEAAATQPYKIETAKIEGQNKALMDAAIARGSNAALAQVPPHLIGPASAAATKAGEDYAQAQSVSQRLQAMMDAARKGNVVSYQLIPQEGALQITTSQGVHRINMAEIQNYGGGSLWQRLQGHIGKQLTGESIPSSVLDDMAEMQRIQAQGSQTKYGNTLKTINQTYGSNFKPVQMDELPQNQTQPTGNSSANKADRLGIR